ncbi:MAG: hypothetical protein HETSPECPRED_007930 [Heterodermia speciosa]|uniref:Rhodopsin domain-containing protein n=1 Tax=Heterodermia speciosa TaxID=116794 RepID=A0A8H3EJK2_9LECA|nr:MAG: hypothetical protein HETSPECPRED_007930 [Heterodermia speciosa]
MNTTLLPPPPGGPQDKGPALLAVALAFTISALLFVLPRVYVRTWMNNAFGWDDVMVIVAMVFAIIDAGFLVPSVLLGYGQHMYYLSDDNLIEALKWYYLVIPPLVISLGASKISICLLLLRILDRTRNKFKRYFPYGIIVISVAVAVPSAGYTLGQCQPLKKLWNPSTPGHCQDPSKYVKFGYANGVVNAVSDFALALFPISFIKDLHLRTDKKVILGVLMCCGVVCGMLAIARTVLIARLATFSDITYRSVDSTILALAEENVSIIVSCVPTLGPAVQLIHDKFKLWKSSQRPIKQVHGSSRDCQSSSPIPLHELRDLRKDIQYDYRAAAAPNTYKNRQDSYESLTSLVPGIRRTTEVEIQRSPV